MFSISKKVLSLNGRRSIYYAKSTIRCKRSCLERALQFTVGTRYSGYIVKQVTEIPELQLVALKLQHEKTGAEHLHVARDDTNNLFSVSVKTIPNNSKGVPHILEHLVLCGSRGFPCRDPFMKMLSRSLATFMNAFTGCDNTMYPFSTQNPTDFRNLLGVYIDAVYHPRLREKDFMQEGWRLDHEKVGDKESPIIIKGVVFNEMKGVFSDPSQLYSRHLLSKLYPSHAYSHSHGGDPLCIPELSWKELKDFHAEYYHPSNSRFFTYGNFPLQGHLSTLHANTLMHFQKKPMKHEVISEKPWSQPREDTIYCRFDPMAATPEKQTTVSQSYLLNEITDTNESFVMSIIGTLLVDGPNAPFYKSLLETGIGSDYSPSTGYEGQLKQGFFSIGLREVDKKDIELVKNTIQETFEKVAKEGFPKERIEALLHNMELGMKHQTTKFGLNAALAVNDLWNHGGDPVEPFKVNKYINWFREQLEANPHFLQDKVDKYFIKNSHRLCLVMTPDEAEEKRMEKMEAELLQSKLNSLNEKEKSEILFSGVKLEEYQKQDENLTCLPTLQLEDVQEVIKNTPLSVEIKSTVTLLSDTANCSGITTKPRLWSSTQPWFFIGLLKSTPGDVPVQFCEQPTNGISYFKALCKVPQLPEHLQLLLPLFTQIVTKMGAGNMDYKQFDQEADLKTGGLSATNHICVHPSTEGRFEHNILFSSHSLQKNIGDMMNLWQLIFNSVTLSDHDRLSQLIKMTAAELAQSIPQNGHLYAGLRASSCLSRCAQLKERLSGITQVLFMKRMAELTDYGEVMSNLKLIADLILTKNMMRCAINADSQSMSPSISNLEKFLSSISHQSFNELDATGEAPFNPSLNEKCHFILPFDVNYIGKSLQTIPYDHEDYASLKIASKLMTAKYLHPEIRERGGAYGGGARFVDGVMTFYSYRDPNVSQTLKSFNEAVEYVIDKGYSHQFVVEAKLGAFGEIDHPVAPGDTGSLQFLHSISDTMKQRLRRRIFAVRWGNVIQATTKYLLQPNYGITLIGPKNEISNNKEWTTLSG